MEKGATLSSTDAVMPGVQVAGSAATKGRELFGSNWSCAGHNRGTKSSRAARRSFFTVVVLIESSQSGAIAPAADRLFCDEFLWPVAHLYGIRRNKPRLSCVSASNRIGMSSSGTKK